MKKTILLAAICAILIVPIYAQNTKSELNNLNKEVIDLYKNGKLEEAIMIADKIVDLAKKNDSVDKETSAVYLATSARLKKEMFEALLNQLRTKKMKSDEASKVGKQANEYAIEADENFKDAIKMFDDLKSESQQAAFAKSQYAWLLYNHPGKQKRAIVRDPNKLERYEDAEKFYLESLAIYDKTMGKDSDQYILANFNIAEFYLNWMRMEKAIPLYERFVDSVEKKYGKNQKVTVGALRSLAEIMVTTEREDEAKAYVKTISAITGTTEALPKAEFDLRLRKKYSAVVNDQRLIENISSENVIGNFNNRLAILQGGRRRGEPATTFSFATDAGYNIRNQGVLVEVLIDENGDVEEAKAIFGDQDVKDDKKIEKLRKTVEKTVKDWRFVPFEYKGKKSKMRGFVIFEASEFRG